MEFRSRPEGTFGEPLPDMVKQFVVYFYRHIRARNINEVRSMYSVSFAKLTERFFKGTTWPPAESITHWVDNDHVFLLLYKEMYFRHLYATMQPTLDQRRDSWENYNQLFSIILGSNVNMQLPNEWLWDMVDEFIYQFQSFCQYRGKLAQRSSAELDALRGCGGVWAVAGVRQYLQAFVDRSDIGHLLSMPGGAKQFLESKGLLDERSSNVLRMLGYFSLVGLCRVLTLEGQYEPALRAIHPLNPHLPQDLYTSDIAGCHITLYYYTGFSYMMLQRYVDAARVYNVILAYIVRVKHEYVRSPQYDQILKKNEQMYATLAITLALCPAAQRDLDENVSNQLKEKYGEKIQRMLRNDEGTYDELFSYACPKFITTESPSLDGPLVNSNQEAYRAQLQQFLGLIQEQRNLPKLKEFLKLYTAISLPKLASLMEMEEGALLAELSLLERACMCRTWAGKGGAAEGELRAAADVEFTVAQDGGGQRVIHVAESKPVRAKSDFLQRHITQFEEIIRDLNRPPAVALVKPASALPAY